MSLLSRTGQHKLHTGKKKERERGANSKHEEPISCDPARRRIVLGVQRIEQGARNQILWPDHGGGVDEQPPTKTSKAKSGELRRKDQSEVEPGGASTRAKTEGAGTHQKPSLML